MRWGMPTLVHPERRGICIFCAAPALALDNGGDDLASATSINTGLAPMVVEKASMHSTATDLTKVVQLAQIALRDRRRRARDKCQQELNAMREWQAGTGERAKMAWMDTCPGLRGFSCELRPVPLRQGVDGAIFQQIASAKVLGALACYVSKHAARSNLEDCLFKDWSAKHRAIMHDDSPAIGREKHEPKGMCRRRAFCLCNFDGALVSKMRNRFVSWLMSRCPKDSQMRTHLANRNIVVRMSAHRPAVTDDLERELVLLQNGKVDEERLVVWFHIGDLMLSPYQPTFHRLVEDDMDEECDDGDVKLQDA